MLAVACSSALAGSGNLSRQLRHAAAKDGTFAVARHVDRLARLVLLFATLLLFLGTTPAPAQGQGQTTGVGLASSNQVRVRIEAPLTNPDDLLLQSADSPLGPWWKEAEFQRNPAPNGYDFFTPLKKYYPQRFYRFGLFGRVLPYIRFIAPKPIFYSVCWFLTNFPHGCDSKLNLVVPTRAFFFLDSAG
jgi:hypothetical protein